MTLAMTRSWQHPKTGISWLTKRVPKDLMLLVGKREEKLSLATRDPAEAKRRLVRALADVEARWAVLRSAPPEAARAAEPIATTLNEREAHRRAEWMYSYWLWKHRDNPSAQTFWPVEGYDRIWNTSPARNADHWSVASRKVDATSTMPTFDMRALLLEQWCFKQADVLLMAHDMQVDQDSRTKLAKALAASVQRASVKLARWARGNYEPDEGGPAPPPPNREAPAITASAKAALPFEELVRGWAAEKRPVAVSR